MPHPLLNKPAPTVTCPNADGEDFTFTPGASGKPAVVFFVPSVGACAMLLRPHDCSVDEKFNVQVPMAAAVRCAVSVISSSVSEAFFVH